jgi:hypothetical protein
MCAFTPEKELELADMTGSMKTPRLHQTGLDKVLKITASE